MDVCVCVVGWKSNASLLLKKEVGVKKKEVRLGATFSPDVIKSGTLSLSLSCHESILVVMLQWILIIKKNSFLKNKSNPIGQ